MALWWAFSPYHDVGIYLPGRESGPINAPRPRHLDLILLDSKWVDPVVAQGWGIIPIWSGPQAPCAINKNLVHHFSAVPATAHTEGVNQAAEAYASAQALGLDGSIIYVDIENTTAPCADLQRRTI